MDGSTPTCVAERHQHDQGDHNVDAEADSHFYVDPTELLFVFRNSLDILVPILVWPGQTKRSLQKQKSGKRGLLDSDLRGGGAGT